MRTRGDLVQQIVQSDWFRPVEHATCLERRQLHHPVDDFLDTQRFSGDVAEKAFAFILRHGRFLQQLGGAADRRQRALHFVREGLNVIGDVVASGQCIAHFPETAAQRVDGAPDHARQAQPLLRPDPGDVVGDQPERPHQPGRDDHRQYQQRESRAHTHPQRARPRVLDELAEALDRLADADHADDLVVPADRCADVHHRRAGVAFDIARGPRTIEPRQGAADVVPARKIRAGLQPARIEQHTPVPVGDVDAHVDAALVQVVDLRRELTPGERPEDRFQPCRVDGACDHVLLDQARHQLRGVDQRLLGRFAVARIDVRHHAVEQEGDACRVDQQDAEEYPGALAHPAGKVREAGRSSYSA